MGAIVEHHHQRYPHLVYVPQEISGLDLLLWGESTADLGRSDPIPLYATHSLQREGKVKFFVDPWTWMAFLAEQDFVFGTRIHGNIAGLLAGTPSYVIAHDSRTLELARYFDLPHKKITELSADTDARELYEAADYTAMHSGHRERFEVLLAFMARHGLDCSFGPAGGAAEFDERVRELTFPGAVTPLTTENAKDRLRALKDDTVVLRRELRRTTSKAERLEATSRKLGTSLDRARTTAKSLSAENAKLAKRLAKAERAITQLRNTPYRRLRRRVGRVVRKLSRRGR